MEDHLVNNHLLKQMIDAENSHDLDRVLALLTDNVVIEDVPFGMLLKGKEAMRQA